MQVTEHKIPSVFQSARARTVTALGAFAEDVRVEGQLNAHRINDTVHPPVPSHSYTGKPHPNSSDMLGKLSSQLLLLCPWSSLFPFQPAILCQMGSRMTSASCPRYPSPVQPFPVGECVAAVTSFQPIEQGQEIFWMNEDLKAVGFKLIQMGIIPCLV